MGKKKSVTTDSTRDKAQKMRLAQQRKDRMVRNVVIGVAAAVVALVLVAVVVVAMNHKNPAADLSENQRTELLGDYASGAPIEFSHLGVGELDPSLPTLTEYFDYSCHVCAQQEVEFGQQILDSASEGNFNIEFQPVITVGMPYNNAAATASLVVAQKDPEHWEGFHVALLTKFHEYFTSGNGTVIQDPKASFKEVTQIAKDAGVSQDAIDLFVVDGVSSYLETTTNAWRETTYEGIQLDQQGNPRRGTPEYVKDHTSLIQGDPSTLGIAIITEMTSGDTSKLTGDADEATSGEQTPASGDESASMRDEALVPGQ